MEAANELCKCDKHVNIVEKFVPYSFATINPYRKSETRMDGTPCECDEFPFSHLYRKQFRIGDKSCFDNTATVKLPPYWIEWRQRPMQLTENRLTWPKALPLNKSVSDGVLNYNRRPEKVLKHEISLKYYTPPNAQYVKMIYN
ncbi:uncharacterized protein LOC113203583 [Frankliniella occidentalis]|uniref:Uncharacterized protein LOC113203583 n=1 Tax=Frankliniella occidentalis TaxID=133901 RepID=A0A6J1S4M6_FRAOC|nr:uncharacterized protein LOC113203583 [Frankliniella occidentalis]